MISKKYHAIVFVSILVMLLLLGLHLLGFGLLSSGSGSTGSLGTAGSVSAALTRNSTTTTSSSSLLTPSGASSSSVYQYPIIYDKLTGATNNQINDVLSNPKHQAPDQYPIDHYQEQQQQQQQQLQNRQQSEPLHNPFEPFSSQDVVVDPFASMPVRRQPFLAPLQRPSPSHNNNNHNNNYYDLMHQSPPPHQLGAPEVPLSIDDYNARQARLRGLNNQMTNSDQQQQQQQGLNIIDKQQVNLLAEPQAQQRHKQQMLDRRLLFGGGGPATSQGQQQHSSYDHPAGYFGDPQTLTDNDNNNNNNNNNFTSAAYYPALDGRLTATSQQQQPIVILSDKQLAFRPPPPPSPPQSQSSGQQPPTQDAQPTCARQQQPLAAAHDTVGLNSLNGADGTVRQLAPVLFCNEDADYPTSDIMRALENYASERSVELILPQPLVQMLIQSGASSGKSRSTSSQKLAQLQRQLSLDSLQPNINAQLATVVATTLTNKPPPPPPSDELVSTSVVAGKSGALFESSNYEPMCKAATWMAQPRRAKNLLGQWKVIVNLIGHKYRGTAISQMVRIEECSRPDGECSSLLAQSSSGSIPLTASSSSTALARSRCLQLYDNQRLLAWSHKQGLHFDIFRMPSACSCHNRRF